MKRVRFLRRLSQFFSLTALAALIQAPLHAQFGEDPPASPVVNYNPTIKSVEGLAPYSVSYDITVTSPVLPVGYLIAGVLDPYASPLAISLNSTLTAIGVPAGGADPATFLSISGPAVTFNGGVPQVTFTGPGQTRTFTVTVAIPANTPPTTAPYTYKIKTSGWPATMLARLVTLGAPLADGATFVNATVTDPANLYTKPVANITVPADGAPFTVAAASLPTYAVDFTTVFTSNGLGASQMSSTVVEVTHNGLPVALSNVVTTTDAPASGFQKTTTGKILARDAGTYTITARATNAGGTSDDDTSTFSITVTAPPPTVTINEPALASYDYRYGSAPISVPFKFTGGSLYGKIVGLTATIDDDDGVVDPTDILFSIDTNNPLNTPTAIGSSDLGLFSAAGSYTIRVTATNAVGEVASATKSFAINLIKPTPTTKITSLNGSTGTTLPATFSLPSGATTMNVPFVFASTSNNGFAVDSVRATIDGNLVSGISTPAIGTAATTSSGTLSTLAAGSHVLVVTAVSAGLEVTDTFTFTISGVQPPPPGPVVVINTPAPGTPYSRLSTGPAVVVPLNFTGTAKATGAVIKTLTARLGASTPLTVASSTLNQVIATGTSSISLTTAGTYTITVTATDSNGASATAETYVVVTVVTPKTVCGKVFFDLDHDDVFDAVEFGLNGIGVKLLNASNLTQVIASATTGCDGSYTFPNIAPGSYVVSATPYAGLKATTSATRNIVVAGSNLTVPAIGFELNFTALRGLAADGYSHGFWKNNVDKAIAGKSTGTQVSTAAVKSYTDKMGSLALSPYDSLTLKQASAILGSTSSQAKDLLSKQLVASEYNYENGAFIGGNANLTFLFVYWGENVLKNSTSYTATYLTWTKDWFDAYNNSHGGLVAGPAP